MSVKHQVIFAFMLVFLAVMLTTIGLYLHFSTELEIKQRELQKWTEAEEELRGTSRKLDSILNHTDPNENPKTKAANEARKAEKIYNAIYKDDAAIAPIFESKVPKLKESYEKAVAEYQKVYQDWKERNVKIRENLDALKKRVDQNAAQIEAQKQDLSEAIKQEGLKRNELIVLKKAQEEELGKIRYGTEDLRDKISSVTREIETAPQREADGKVIFSAPDLQTVVVDIGFQEGARKGMKFDIYSGFHNVPIKKGVIQLTQIRAHSSDAIAIEVPESPK